MIFDRTLRNPDVPQPATEFMPAAYPRAMLPYYGMKEPNEPIALYEGTLQITTKSGRDATAAGDITLTWSPKPSTRFRTQRVGVTGMDIFLFGDTGNGELLLPNSPAPHPVFVTGIADDLVGIVRGPAPIGPDRPMRYIFLSAELSGSTRAPRLFRGGSGLHGCPDAARGTGLANRYRRCSTAEESCMSKRKPWAAT